MTASDEHEVWLSVTDREDTDQRSVRTGPPPSHRPRRAAGSLSGRSSARRPKVARPLTRHSTRSNGGDVSAQYPTDRSRTGNDPHRPVHVASGRRGRAVLHVKRGRERVPEPRRGRRPHHAVLHVKRRPGPIAGSRRRDRGVECADVSRETTANGRRHERPTSTVAARIRVACRTVWRRLAPNVPNRGPRPSDGRINDRESVPGRSLSGPDDRLREPEGRRRQDHDGGQSRDLSGASPATGSSSSISIRRATPRAASGSTGSLLDRSIYDAVIDDLALERSRGRGGHSASTSSRPRSRSPAPRSNSRRSRPASGASPASSPPSPTATTTSSSTARRRSGS